MRMIPEKVKVAGIEYSVEYKPVVIINSSTNYAGSCDYAKTTIEILDELSETKKEQTFVHELLHACFNEAGYNDQDEDTINRVSIVLYQVLKDNELKFGD